MKAKNQTAFPLDAVQVWECRILENLCMKRHRLLYFDRVSHMSGHLDLEQGPLSKDAARITPDQALDALMILRFFKGHALAGAPPLAPARGSITRIITTRPDESKRLKTLLKTRMRDILSDVDISPQNPDSEDIQLIRHAGADASRADTVRCIELIETAVLAGHPAIVLLSGSPRPMRRCWPPSSASCIRRSLILPLWRGPGSKTCMPYNWRKCWPQGLRRTLSCCCTRSPQIRHVQPLSRLSRWPQARFAIR